MRELRLQDVPASLKTRYAEEHRRFLSKVADAGDNVRQLEDDIEYQELERRGAEFGERVVAIF